MSVTVGEILVAVKAGLAALTSETVGYLVLGAADRVSQASPASFDAADIELDERGMVTVPGIRPAVQDRSETQLRTVLGELLDHAQSGAPALDRVKRDGERGSGRLIGQIEAALIPVNRAAARRALARLHRDVMRAKASGELARSAAPTLESPAPPETPVSEPDLGTPAIELPPIELCTVGAPIEPAAAEAPIERWAVDTSEREEWEAAVSKSSGAPIYEPEATPFLGAWPVAQIPEHDTDHAPPVVTDEPVVVVPVDRSDVEATTQVLFATAVATPLAPPIEPERPLDDVARIMGPVWTPIVEAEVSLVHLAIPEDPPEPTESESEDSWIVSLLAPEEQSPAPEVVPESAFVASIDDEIVALGEAQTEPPEVDLAEIEVAEIEVAEIEVAEIEVAEIELAKIELAKIELAETELAVADHAEPEPVESAPREELPLFVPVEDQPSVLSPARHAGWVGWILTRVDPQLVELSEALLDGPSIASVPRATEGAMLSESTEPSCQPPVVADPICAAAETTEVWEEIDVTYDDESVEEPAVEAAEQAAPLSDEGAAEFLTAPPSEALLAWVVRDGALYEEILGVQDDFGDFDAPRDIAADLAAQEDIGEIDWIRAEEELAETLCEVPVAKYDPRESYAPEAMLSRWEPVPELDSEAIDAGWEIESESSLPPVAVSSAPSSDPFSTESPTPPPYRPRQSDISELLAGFVVAETRSLREMSRELQRIAGVAATPAPPNVSPLAADGGGVETSRSCTSRTWRSSRDS